MQLVRRQTRYLLLFCLSSLLLSIHLFIERHQSEALIPLYFLAFGCYYFLTISHELSLKEIVYAGSFMRLLMFFGDPALSDDFYRFIWDGRLINQGIHPFLYLPSEIIANYSIPGVDTSLFEKLNSQDYFTIYPSISQLIFYLSTFSGTHEIFWEVLTMRSILFCFDIGSMMILWKLLRLNDMPISKLSLFAFNPLIILELTGNLHFEGVMIFFLLLFVYLYMRKSLYGAAVALAFAISTKVVPLIFIPYVFFKERHGRGILFSLTAGLICVVLAVPLLSATFITHLQKSIMLFINNFEFNASIYFLVRAIGSWLMGYNPIAFVGPLLSLIVFVGISALGYIAGRKIHMSMVATMVLSLTIYLLFSTTVHPWYSLPLLSLAILTKFKYPVLWTALIFISYIGYSADGYGIKSVWLFLEYISLFAFMIYEFNESKKVHSTPVQHIDDDIG